MFVLIHSPLVGPLTWHLVADELRKHGSNVLVPNLEDLPDAKVPYWKQHAASVSRALTHIAKDTSLILVAHSGAGPLLPAIRESLVNPVHAYVFVDAGIPCDGASRIDLMKSEDPEWGEGFQQELEKGERFPTWSFDDLQEVIPDASLRRQMISELRPRGLDFFTEPIPVFDGWPDAPCIYIQFSPPYERPAEQAREAGWQLHKLDAGHFHMLVDARALADLLFHSVAKITN